MAARIHARQIRPRFDIGGIRGDGFFQQRQRLVLAMAKLICHGQVVTQRRHVSVDRVSPFVELDGVSMASRELQRVAEMPERGRVLRILIDEFGRKLSGALAAALFKQGVDEFKSRVHEIGPHRQRGLQPHRALYLRVFRVHGSGVQQECRDDGRDNGVRGVIELGRCFNGVRQGAAGHLSMRPGRHVRVNR